MYVSAVPPSRDIVSFLIKVVKLTAQMTNLATNFSEDLLVKRLGSKILEVGGRRFGHKNDNNPLHDTSYHSLYRAYHTRPDHISNTFTMWF